MFAAPDCTSLQLFSAESSVLALKHQPFGIAITKLNLAFTDSDSIPLREYDLFFLFLA